MGVMAIDLSRYEEGTPPSGDYGDRLDELQQRLSRLFVSNIVYRRKAIIVFEGWDASGKGGAIQRLVAKSDPRGFKVWPIAAPTADELAHHYLWRFWQRLPAAGEIAIFDRSWYGRVLVERVENLVQPAQWQRAYDEINEFEATQCAEGTLVIKLFFHVTQEQQDARLRARLEHPWKRWKLKMEDMRNRARRQDYMAALGDMFAHTDTRWAPWQVIDGNNKKAARLAALQAIAGALEGALPGEPPPADPELMKAAENLE
jgi:polyphosphate kinase 2 (PPK2 family)